ncbi:concanavalin A-like lectin/glucanase domain-containing protein, partial [Leucosporidium creatinivorum]
GATELSISFSSYTSSDSVASFLEAQGLAISNYDVGSTPYIHNFDAANVDIVDGVLNLMVLGGTKEGGSVSSSEVATVVDNILFGEITTRARATKVPGVCHGFFYYLASRTESLQVRLSFIFLSSRSHLTLQSPPVQSIGLEFTNHGSTSTNKYVPYDFGDPTVDFHDYTVLWTAESTQFLVDGKMLATITENVPSKPGPWLFNSWSSGEPNWSAGPPTEDSVLEIESISGYYYTG